MRNGPKDMPERSDYLSCHFKDIETKERRQAMSYRIKDHIMAIPELDSRRQD